MIDPQQLERRPNCVVGLSSQCCSRHAGKNGLLCAVLLLGSLAHLVLTSKCASRHNDVHFFGISTSKSGPELVCFVHFDLEMCFTPQRRALFRHLNFKKCSDREVFLAFSLANVLCATTACTFPTSQLPKVVQSWCVLYILTWKCASRHNGMHFLDISASKGGLNVKCFVHFDFEMYFALLRRALFRHLNFQK